MVEGEVCNDPRPKVAFHCMGVFLALIELHKKYIMIQIVIVEARNYSENSFDN